MRTSQPASSMSLPAGTGLPSSKSWQSTGAKHQLCRKRRRRPWSRWWTWRWQAGRTRRRTARWPPSAGWLRRAGDAAAPALRPALDERAPDLVKQIDSRFAAVDAALAKHRKGDGYRLHDELSQAELKELSDVINAVAEPISKVAAVVALGAVVTGRAAGDAPGKPNLPADNAYTYIM